MKKVFIIAEAGVNHNGSLQLAKQLIDAAAKAGVDAVKFQTWKTELIVTKAARQAAYQIENTRVKESQFDMLKKLELSYADFRELKKYCDEKKIIFISTADEIVSADFLFDLQDIFKIGSGEITNLPYLRHIGQFQKSVILSTGMATLGEIEAALDALEEVGTPRSKVTVMHCTTEYPTPMHEVNLHAIQNIQKAFGVEVGYSDHTQGIEVTIAAAALGASVIEKHFTLDRNLPGPDHQASIEPAELKAMVDAIRNIEKALGDGIKRPMPNETRNKLVVRKSLVANRAIRAGELFTAENLIAKRPGTGISPMRWDEIIGKKALRDFACDELIQD